MVRCGGVARKFIDATEGSSDSNTLRVTHILLVDIKAILIQKEAEAYNRITMTVMPCKGLLCKILRCGDMFSPLDS